MAMMLVRAALPFDVLRFLLDRGSSTIMRPTWTRTMCGSLRLWPRTSKEVLPLPSS